MSDSRPLTPKQAAFIQEYLIDLNATQAAIRAGYSAKTAYSIGISNLRKVEITSELAKAMAARGVRTQITQDRVMLEVRRLATADVRKVVRWGVKDDQPYVEPINSDELSDDDAAAIAEVSMTKEGIRIKMHDKGGALTLAGRHLGMWKDRLEVTTDGFEEGMAAADARLEGEP